MYVLEKNYWLLLIKLHWSCFKYIDLLHTLNVYETSVKKHQVVDFWVADEVSALQILFLKYLEYVPLILRNHKKLKMTKFLLWFSIFSILSAP